MKIAHNAVVSLDYTLTDDDGKVIDQSDESEPLEYLHGHGQIVPGLERALEGQDDGQSLEVSVAPADGYGVRDEKKKMTIPRADLPSDLVPEVGMHLSGEGQDGNLVPLWIVDVQADHVALDGNHPLAGQTLHFQIHVRAVRQATSEELSHGHAHGAHGHHH